MYLLTIAFRFENDVKTYGTETCHTTERSHTPFENDVKTYGTETQNRKDIHDMKFENDVKTYGTETVYSYFHPLLRLRMM